ncbi:MAG: hypothetical protein H6828_12380 [Planctomycetes bacterium]|nr:hypothetical protein [Planctomycetota bacterium]
MLWTPAAGLALVAGLSGSALLGELSGGVAGAAGAALVLAWWRPRLALARGGAETALFFLAALLLNAHYYSYTTGVDALLVTAGVAAPCALLAPPLARLGGARRAWLGFALAALPVAIAVTRAVLAFEPDPYAGYY